MPETTIVVGGGITGLAAAYMAARNGRKVIVLEGSAQVGGLLNTFELGGNRLEHYYHHFFTHDAEIGWLLRELGLEDKVSYQRSTMAVYRNGRLYSFNSPPDLFRFKPISWPGKFRFACTTLFLTKIAIWTRYEGVAAYQWFRRWAGRSVTDALWGPMLKVKFGPYFDRVPLSWMIGRLRQRMNSRKQGDERLGYLHGSLQILSDALQNRLAGMGVDIRTGEPVEAIACEGDSVRSLKTPSGIHGADEFLFTIPTVHLNRVEGLPEDLQEKLVRIEYFGVYCMIIALTRPLSNIYWLNVADPGYSFGGVIEHTNLVNSGEYGGLHVVYLSRYFAHSDDIAGMERDAVAERMLGDLRRMHPELRDDEIVERHLFRSNTAAMVNDLEFSAKVPACKTSIPNLYLCNMAHIYPDERSVNNSIRIAAEAIRTMGMDSSFVPANLSLSGQIGFSGT